MMLSVISHFYNNERTLLRLLDSFKKMNTLRPGLFDFVLVDDHSHEPVNASSFAEVDNLRVFRIVDDVAWNMPAARNIGMKEALCEKALLIDIDHSVDSDRLDAFLDDVNKLQPGQIGSFRRKKLMKEPSEHWADIGGHMNSYVIHKSDFDRIGGYEELFSGNYGQEDKYFRVCCRKNGMSEIEFQSALLTQGGATQNLDRDKSINAEKLKHLMAEKAWRAKRYLSYKWEQIYPRGMG